MAEARDLGDAAPTALSAAASRAAEVESAWLVGGEGWDCLAADWAVDASALTVPDAAGDLAVPPSDVTGRLPPAVWVPGAATPVRCWWDGPPWNGQIADAEFRAIVAAYVAQHGSYTPDLPAREPGVLREWLRANGYAHPTAPQEAA
jgi:hypothetical protein